VFALKISKKKYKYELDDRKGESFLKCVELLKPMSKYLRVRWSNFDSKYLVSDRSTFRN
jgi:hypothetical protein